jgi:hypothetical protein
LASQACRYRRPNCMIAGPRTPTAAWPSNSRPGAKLLPRPRCRRPAAAASLAPITVATFRVSRLRRRGGHRGVQGLLTRSPAQHQARKGFPRRRPHGVPRPDLPEISCSGLYRQFSCVRGHQPTDFVSNLGSSRHCYLRRRVRAKGTNGADRRRRHSAPHGAQRVTCPLDGSSHG